MTQAEAPRYGACVFDLRETQRRWRNRLPHWEVKGASFFITVRCAGSLPREAAERIRVLSDSILSVDAESEQYSRLQRQLFVASEKYLDSGYGFSPFETGAVAETFVEQLSSWAVESKWTLEAYCVMPNHIHLLARKDDEDSLDLKPFMTRLKGSTARCLNEILSRSGAFWHPDWFDRWMRSEAEKSRTANYIMNNPVKGGLVKNVEDYKFSYRSAELQPAATLKDQTNAVAG